MKCMDVPVFVKVECYVQQFLTVVFNYVVTISIKNHLFLSTLFNQIDYVDVVVDTEFLVEMFLECQLSFGVIWK